MSSSPVDEYELPPTAISDFFSFIWFMVMEDGGGIEAVNDENGMGMWPPEVPMELTVMPPPMLLLTVVVPLLLLLLTACCMVP